MAKEIRPTNLKPPVKKTIADKLVDIVGSWKFIVTQSVGMLLWMLLNVATPHKVDPFPFIMLNFLLSTQAAFLGPVILMSSRQNESIDRKRDIDHYQLDKEDNLTITKMSEDLAKLTDKIEEGCHPVEKALDRRPPDGLK